MYLHVYVCIVCIGPIGPCLTGLCAHVCTVSLECIALGILQLLGGQDDIKFRWWYCEMRRVLQHAVWELGIPSLKKSSLLWSEHSECGGQGVCCTVDGLHDLPIYSGILHDHHIQTPLPIHTYTDVYITLHTNTHLSVQILANSIYLHLLIWIGV